MDNYDKTGVQGQSPSAGLWAKPPEAGGQRVKTVLIIMLMQTFW